jgi:hypothetical protein
MSSPLQQTTDVDVDAVPEFTVEESRAPAGSTGGPLPVVGTNTVNEWAMWDPNLWWTDWSLPPDPRPSWEQWFEWVNQLRALTPALGEASRDWQTMLGQFDESLQNVRAMRADLAGWTGPSAQTMSESLDRLEDSITTKSTAIRENPARLQELARTINDAVPPMSALDAEYQQVLQDLNACRQVAERGKPIMENLATRLLQIGTDLQNSVRVDNLAPQPVPRQALALADGPQGPGQQLTQVAGSSGLADPGAFTPSDQIAVADQPAPIGPSGLVDPGAVATSGAVPVTGQPGVATGTPGVVVGPADQTATLAGLSAGTTAPTVTQAPVAAASVAAPTAVGAAAPAMPFTAAPAAGAMLANSAGPGSVPGEHRTTTVSTSATTPATTPVAPVVAPAVAPAADRRDDKNAAHATPAVLVPVPIVAPGASGAAAVPAALLGRAGGQARCGQHAEDGTEPRVPDAFKVRDAGTGTISAPT